MYINHSSVIYLTWFFHWEKFENSEKGVQARWVFGTIDTVWLALISGLCGPLSTAVKKKKKEERRGEVEEVTCLHEPLSSSDEEIYNQQMVFVVGIISDVVYVFAAWQCCQMPKKFDYSWS